MNARFAGPGDVPPFWPVLPLEVSILKQDDVCYNAFALGGPPALALAIGPRPGFDLQSRDDLLDAWGFHGDGHGFGNLLHRINGARQRNHAGSRVYRNTQAGNIAVCHEFSFNGGGRSGVGSGIANGLASLLGFSAHYLTGPCEFVFDILRGKVPVMNLLLESVPGGFGRGFEVLTRVVNPGLALSGVVVPQSGPTQKDTND